MYNEEYYPLKLLRQELAHFSKILPEVRKLDNFDSYKVEREMLAEVTGSFWYNDAIRYRWTEQKVMALMFQWNPLLAVAEEWKKTKQVYSYSFDFFKILSDMDDYVIETEVLNYLPFKTFYVETVHSKWFHGILVKYYPVEKYIELFIFYRKPNKNQTIGRIELDLVKNKTYYDVKRTIESISISKLKDMIVDEECKTLAFIFQFCMYLCAKNSDVEKSKTHKNRKNKSYKEIKKWDVGYRVVKEHKTNFETSNKTLDDEVKENKLQRNRPRQHWRKAHWHTYCVGPGRKERILKFIAPILVNDIADNMPIVDRKLLESEE